MYTEEMTKEELQKLLDEYRDKNVQLEIERDTYKHALEKVMNHKNLYREAIVNLSKVLMNLTEEEA